MIDSRFPIGSTITLEKLAENPYPILEQLQQYEPISWVESVQMWFVTRRADVITIMQDKKTFTVESSRSVLRDTFGLMMLGVEGDTHTRLRQPFNAPFLPKAVRADASDEITRRTNQLIDTFINERQVDLTSAFADPLALYTVTAILGVPIENYNEFRGWYNDFNAALGNFTHDPAIRERGQSAARKFRENIGAHLHTLRAEPDGSILSNLVNENPPPLTDEELLSASLVIIFGGLETTAAMFSNTIWALLNHPEQFNAVKRDSALIDNAVEEALRWESPVQTVTRQVTADSEFGGVMLRRGEMVQGMLGAANRDPAYFQQPERFDIYRANAADHLAFGIGKHYCLGAALARLEGQIGLRILFERLPNLHLHPEYPSKPYGHEFRSMPSLVVQWAKGI